MKRILLLACLIAALLPIGTSAQGGKVWLPLIIQDCGGSHTVSDWKIIVPEATTNKVLNPSAETTGNFAAVGGGTMTRVTTYQKYGLYSYRIQTAADNQGGSLTLSALANAIHYVTVRVRGTLPASWDWSLNNSNYTSPTLIEAIDANWSLYGLQFPAAQANGSTTLYIRQNGAGSGDFYIDGVQVEEKSYWTTYVDGERQGCSWNGAAHASTSSRSAVSRAGGRIRDLQSDYGFNISGMIGLGAPPHTVTVDEYALLPGGELNAIKVHPRPFTLTGFLNGTSYSNLDSLRQALIGVLTPDAYPKDEFGWQPVRLIYTGAASKRQISAHYESGLEGNVSAEGPCYMEKLAVRFLSTDNPFWEDAEGAESAAVLDIGDSYTFRYIAARLRSTGQWDDLGLTSNPTGGGNIYAIARAPDGSIYIGGGFTGWNGVAGRDYIARYIPSTDTWQTVGGASNFNSVIWDLAFGPDGKLYAAGQFTNVAGNANADYLVVWDGVSWSNVGQPVQGAAIITLANQIAFDHGGNLYIVGDFNNWADIANADMIVKWNGSAYSAVGTGAGSSIDCVAIDANDNVYVGGSFGIIGGDGGIDRLAKWNGTTWSQVGGINPNGTVHDLHITADNTLYIGGEFTNMASITEADYIAGFNGTSWFALGSGLNNICYAITGFQNDIYAVGTFTQAGGLDTPDRIAKWNGASWAHVDVDLPGVAFLYEIVVDNQDPIVPANHDLFVGLTDTGAGTAAGKVTVTNSGTEKTYPIIIFTRSGGTSATLETIRNETMGKELLFDYSLLNGETLTIDLDPMQKSIVSSFFGPRPDAILANSDFGEFALQSGNNDITCFVAVAGAPTITAYMTWQNQYR